MKLSLLFFALSILISLNSCEEESALTANPKVQNSAGGTIGGGGSNTTNGSMTARVDGANFTAASATGNLLQGVFSVSGIAADQSLITITLSDFKEDTFDLLNVVDGANAVYQVSGGNTYAGGSLPGSVIISSINRTNKRVVGTFLFQGVDGAANDTASITQGQFSVPYSTSLPGGGSGGGSTSNTLSAEVDGTPFNPTSVTAIKISLTNQLTITASDNQLNETVGITVPPDVIPGTYALGSILSDYIGQYNRGNEAYGSNSGSLIITKHDLSSQEIAGTFDFVATYLLTNDTVNVTNGSFSATY